MNARKIILDAVEMNKPDLTAMPDMPAENIVDADVLEMEFEKMVAFIGGKMLKTADLKMVQNDLNASLKQAKTIVNRVEEIGPLSTEVNVHSDAEFLEPVYKVFLQAELGVAENGAVWLTEKNMQNRLLPFICQHLVVLLKKEFLVSDMHAAYRRIKIDEFGFGLFLAGPSKTADIEQSLVIGAHGARSLLIYLLG